MIGSTTVARSARGGVAVTAVAAVVAALFAVIGLTATPAVAADNITFRASSQSAANSVTHRVTIPAAVRETDALLLFVTSNKPLASVAQTPAGWTRVGTRLSSTDTETILYSKVAAADDAGRSQAVDFTATTKATLTLLAYDGTAAATRSPPSRRPPRRPTGRRTRRPARTWRPRARTSCPTGPTSPRRPPAGPSRPARPSAASSLGTGPGRITAVASDPNAPAPTGRRPAAPPPRASPSAKATMWTVVLQADPDVRTRTWPPSRRSR